nr:MAG TPA: hypothetical protein [Caudoviricetes sp.]
MLLHTLHLLLFQLRLINHNLLRELQPHLHSKKIFIFFICFYCKFSAVCPAFSFFSC